MPRRRAPRDNRTTDRFAAGEFDAARADEPDETRGYDPTASVSFNKRNKHAEQNKIARTALLRNGTAGAGAEVAALPVGRVIQFYSLYCEVADLSEANAIEPPRIRLCTVRKTLNRLAETRVVVGDRVRFREGKAGGGGPLEAEGVIEAVLPRDTLLTRAESFKGIHQHPIVSNAQRVLVVVGAAQPRPKWGLIDRVLVAAKAGGLEPVICLNKMDLLAAPTEAPTETAIDEPIDDEDSDDDLDTRVDPLAAMAHYASIGIVTLMTSVETGAGLDELRAALAGRETVLAGHSGVGKSSLISAVQPGLDLRVAEVSEFNDKGKHTTTSARRYPLDAGGAVIDTPGVKQFGLWNVSRENLMDYFPDVEAETAPPWRVASYERIAESLD